MEDGGYLEEERKWETIIKIYCLKKCLFSIKKKNQKAKKGKSDEIKYLRKIFKIFKILTTKGMQIKKKLLCDFILSQSEWLRFILKQ